MCSVLNGSTAKASQISDIRHIRISNIQIKKSGSREGEVWEAPGVAESDGVAENCEVEVERRAPVAAAHVLVQRALLHLHLVRHILHDRSPSGLFRRTARPVSGDYFGRGDGP